MVGSRGRCGLVLKSALMAGCAAIAIAGCGGGDETPTLHCVGGIVPDTEWAQLDLGCGDTMHANVTNLTGEEQTVTVEFAVRVPGSDDVIDRASATLQGIGPDLTAGAEVNLADLDLSDAAGEESIEVTVTVTQN